MYSKDCQYYSNSKAIVPSGKPNGIMRENLEKIWKWIRDKKTHAVKRWRSTLSAGRSSSSNGIDSGKSAKNYSALSLPANGNRYGATSAPEFEQFFEDPEVKNVIQVRRQYSARESVHENYPVPAPDREDNLPNPFIDRISPNPTPRQTPTEARKSPRQIRFQLPEVHISFEDSPTSRRVEFEDRSSPLPPPEFIWSSVNSSHPTTVAPFRTTVTQSRTTVSPSNSATVTHTSCNSTIFNPNRSISAPNSMETIAINPISPQLQVAVNSGNEGPPGTPPRCPRHNSSISFDAGDLMSSPSRRNSASERARQNLLAQRRQSNVQLVQSMMGRRTSTTIIPLTPAQIHLVRSLWRQIYTSKGPTVIGSSIYHRLCFKCPMVKEQMRRCPLPPNFTNHDSFIKAHSKAVAELVDQIVENLDNLDSMTAELMRIGKTHARALRGELTGKLWNIVAETFIDCTLEWGDKRCRSETVRKAWALIVAFIIEKIKLGHHEQRKLMLATRPSLPSLEVDVAAIRI